MALVLRAAACINPDPQAFAFAIPGSSPGQALQTQWSSAAETATARNDEIDGASVRRARQRAAQLGNVPLRNPAAAVAPGVAYVGGQRRDFGVVELAGEGRHHQAARLRAGRRRARALQDQI